VAIVADEFDITVNREQVPAVVTPVGELDVATSQRFRDCVNQLIDGGAQELVVNLSAITFIDSAGLGVLVGAMKRLRAGGGSFALADPSRGVRRVLEITGLTSMVEIRNDHGE
jgi:anti-sigma B factor antagonist